MKKLLYLVHRLPYPPNKGDKITSYNMLKYFSRDWDIYLGTFVDLPEDWQYVDTVRSMCAADCIVGLPGTARIKGVLRGLLTGSSLSLGYYHNRKLQRWVDETIETADPDAILIFSGVMGRFVQGRLSRNVPVIFDAEDVDSEKWRQYAAARSWPLTWFFRREAEKLLQHERELAASADVSIFVSAEEADLFRKLAPESADKILSRTQGVDSDYFDPSLEFPNPYEEGEKPMLFAGVMDYWPNMQAAIWFCENVLPGVRERDPAATFYVVGMNPHPRVKRLEKLRGVRVTGAVPDMRPYLRHAICACLPLQIARGIQNKALEAMAMELPIVATSGAMTGISQLTGMLTFIADTPEEMRKAAVQVLSHPRQYNKVGRECVLHHYNWDTNLVQIEKLLTRE